MLKNYATAENLFVLGLMSGTSADGIDGALLGCSPSGTAKLLWHEQIPYSLAVRTRLHALMCNADAVEVARAARFVAELHAHAAVTFQRLHPESQIDAIACHGQTLAHAPNPYIWDEVTVAGSLQVLDAAFLAEKTGYPVIYDFRARDLAVGGQGAPLVPFADLHLFGRQLAKDAVILNIGGIANVTVLRQHPDLHVAQAFDTGPGNMLMDAFTSRLSDGCQNYDHNGDLAAGGHACSALVARLLEDEFFRLPPPKSTGRDRFGADFLHEVLTWPEALNLCAADCMASLLAVTVEGIVRAVEDFVLPQGTIETMIMAGGGTLNHALVAALRRRLPAEIRLTTSETFGIPITAREAAAFAVLGAAFLRGIPSNVPIATGATRNVCLGSLAPEPLEHFHECHIL